jgi:hypothetical protein
MGFRRSHIGASCQVPLVTLERLGGRSDPAIGEVGGATIRGLAMGIAYNTTVSSG